MQLTQTALELAPTVVEYNPAMQAVQVPDVASAHVPAGQLEQAAALVAPRPSVVCPLEQLRQATEDVAPKVDEYVSALQSVHVEDAAAAYEPASHAVHARLLVAPTPAE